MAGQIFRRTETKYILTEKQVQNLMWLIEPHLKKDRYFKGTNCSIYFDNDSRYLAIHSLEKPLYKEKIRIRSYGVPRLEDTVFIEIKKKYKGIGNKRRVAVKLSDFYNYLKTGDLKAVSPIIKSELDECFKRYNLKPTMFLAYDRTSYNDKENPLFRLTFDRNIRSRNNRLRLEEGDDGEQFFNSGAVVMEVKALGSYPLYFVKALSKLKIYPQSFSKYGRVTEKVIYKKEQYV
ncbi:polyphosphate polymerase domain-containing protein [Candidatus Saccharibacteria bacterium]|nr:polyphosphate polymerase domain-containing protein [Candidatus Saccharibacteria bacterium]